MQRLLGSERTAQLLLVLMFGLAVANWPLLPDQLPIHWSSTQAAPDSMAPKSFALLFLPVFALVLYLVLRIVPALGSSDRAVTIVGGQSEGDAHGDTVGGGDPQLGVGQDAHRDWSTWSSTPTC